MIMKGLLRQDASNPAATRTNSVILAAARWPWAGSAADTVDNYVAAISSASARVRTARRPAG